MNRVRTLVQDLRQYFDADNMEQAAETLDKLENQVGTESSTLLYGVINEAGNAMTPLTIAHVGADEAIFETREEAENTRQELAEEYGHENFRVHRVYTEPVEGEA